MERVFLDANILFSVAYREHAGLSRLWVMDGVQLVTSLYALTEAYRNLDPGPKRLRLSKRIKAVKVIRHHRRGSPLPRGIVLPSKDRPILEAAISCRAHYLLTSDKQHFGPYFFKRFGGVLIIPPSAYPGLPEG